MKKDYLDILNELKMPTQKSLSDDHLIWICSIIEKYKPKRILEIGVSTGGGYIGILELYKKIEFE